MCNNNDLAISILFLALLSQKNCPQPCCNQSHIPPPEKDCKPCDDFSHYYREGCACHRHK